MFFSSFILMDNRKVLKYCSCLMKVRGKYTKISNKRKTKSKTKTKKVIVPFNPYGICKASVMRGMSPKKNLPCGLIYDYNKYTMRELKAYAMEKNMPLRDKGKPITKKKLINRLKNKAYREKRKLKITKK